MFASADSIPESCLKVGGAAYTRVRLIHEVLRYLYYYYYYLIFILIIITFIINYFIIMATICYKNARGTIDLSMEFCSIG